MWERSFRNRLIGRSPFFEIGSESSVKVRILLPDLGFCLYEVVKLQV